jgi:hypothetical protein
MMFGTHKATEMSGMPLAAIALSVVVLAKNLHGNYP